jgi:hypothetical protein
MLTNNSGGTTTWAGNDSRYVTLAAAWVQAQNRTRFTSYDVTAAQPTGLVVTHDVTSLPGNQTGVPFKLEIDRPLANRFTFDVFDAGGALLSTYAETIPVTETPVPADLAIALTGDATWDNITLIPEPATTAILALAAGRAIIRRRRRTHARV